MAADDSQSRRFGWHTTDVTYYQKDLPEINEAMRDLLERYSGISPDDIAPHLHKMVCPPRHAQTPSTVNAKPPSEPKPGTSSPTPPWATGTSSPSAS